MSPEDVAAFEAWYQAQPQYVQRRTIRLDACEAWRAALEYEPEEGAHGR